MARAVKQITVVLKACSNIINQHIAQILGYIRATGIENGILINFGNAKLQIKKYILSKSMHNENENNTFSVHFATNRQEA